MLVALALLAAAAAEPAEGSSVKLTCLENIRGKSGRARIEIVVGSGALHESESERGVAHFVEHLLLRPLGFDDANATTGWDYTSYFRDARASTLSTAAVDLVRALARLDFEPNAFDRERQVVLNEMELRGTEGPAAASDPIFGGTILARDPAGGFDSVRRLTPEQARSFHRTHYVRGNIAVMIRGAERCDEIGARLGPELRAFPEGSAAPIIRVEAKEPGPRALAGLHSSGTFVHGFYWYDATIDDEIVLQVVAKHLEQRALDELRKSLGITYSPQGRFRRLGPGGTAGILVIAPGHERTVASWYRRTVEELRTTATPLLLTKAAVALVSDAIENDVIRSGLAAIRQERAPESVIQGLTDPSMRRAIATLLSEDRAFGSSTPSGNIASLAILGGFGILVIGVVAVLGLKLARGH